MPKTISDIEKEYEEQIVPNLPGDMPEQVLLFIRTAIPAAFEAVRGEEREIVEPWDGGFNTALAEQKEREDKFMKGEV